MPGFVLAKGEIELIIDSNALIDLKKLDLLCCLSRLTEYKFNVLEEVYNEITWLEQKKVLKEAIHTQLISIESLTEIEELELFSSLSRTLGFGEAASIAYAYCRKCILLSDENNRAFMCEVERTITKKRLKRTPELLAEIIRSKIISLSEINIRIENLANRASTPRDLNDVEHLKHVLELVRKLL